MGQSLYKVIKPEVYAEETSLPIPRFDEAAAQTARPVVPLPHDAMSFNAGDTTPFQSQPTTLSRRKGSWLLAAVVSLFVAAGAIAIGVTTAYFRHNQMKPSESLIPAADATRIDMAQQGSHLNTAPSRSASAAVPKPIRRSPIVRQPVSGSPKPRLVDVLH